MSCVVYSFIYLFIHPFVTQQIFITSLLCPKISVLHWVSGIQTLAIADITLPLEEKNDKINKYVSVK